MSYMDAVKITCGGTGPVAVGDLSDTVSDYDAGERLVIQMNQFFNALKRPAEFEPPVQAVWAAYEAKKVAWEPLGDDKIMRWKNSTAMKQVGIDAAKVTADMQRAYPSMAGSVPSVNVPKPGGDGWLASFAGYLPWIIGGVVVIGAGVYVVPLIVPIVTARMAARKST